MVATACFILFALLALRSLRLSAADRTKPVVLRLVDLIYAGLFIAASLVLLLFVPLAFANIPLLVVILLILALPLQMLTRRRLKQTYHPRPSLFAAKAVAVLVLTIVSLVCVMMIGYHYLTEDERVVKVIVTGNSRPEPVEWKSPEGTLQKQVLAAHEVQFQTPESKPLETLYVYGDQVAIKAKVLRFRPSLNVVGIRNLCRIEYVYNGYTTASRHNTMPHRAQELSRGTNPVIHRVQERFWSFWEGKYFQTVSEPWVKSATLESNFFPLVREDGVPFRGSWFLTITPGGLSSVPLP
jgi:hypothetical protein